MTDKVPRRVLQQQQKENGHWELCYHYGDYIYRCSHCLAQAPYYYMSNEQKKTRYCYNCGTLMEDPTNES